jgi:hypothetical protein
MQKVTITARTPPATSPYGNIAVVVPDDQIGCMFWRERKSTARRRSVSMNWSTTLVSRVMHVVIAAQLAGCTQYLIADSSARELAELPSAARSSTALPALRLDDRKQTLVLASLINVSGAKSDDGFVRAYPRRLHSLVICGIVLFAVTPILLGTGVDFTTEALRRPDSDAEVWQIVAGPVLTAFGAATLIAATVTMTVGARRRPAEVPSNAPGLRYLKASSSSRNIAGTASVRTQR